MICIRIVSFHPKYYHSNLAHPASHDDIWIFLRIEYLIMAHCVFPLVTFTSLSIYIKLTILVWADNADACSTQYAGTGALKTDFTR